MKFIRPLVYTIIIIAIVSIFTIQGFTETDQNRLGTISSVDNVKKEIFVKKDKPGSEVITGAKFYARIDGKVVMLEAVNPMFAQVKCRAVNASDFTAFKNDMKIYLYTSDIKDENLTLTDAELAEKEKSFLTAAQKGDTARVRYFIQAGVKINATTGEFAPDLFTGYNSQESSYFTALHLAAVWNRADIVELLLNAGADHTTGYYTAYSYALSCNNLDCARIFIRRNADKGADGITPLVRAVIIDDKAAVKKLLADGSDVNERSYVNRTALMFAVTGEMATILIAAGADPNLVDTFNSSALWNMSNSGYIEPVKVILGKFHGRGLEVDNHGSYGDTPLMRAAMMGYTDMVKLLFSKGADINAVNEYGSTALILSAAEGHTDVVSFLLQNGAGVNASNTNGDTALIQAAYNGQKKVVEILLESGADAGIAASDGKTAVDLAQEKGYTEIADMIRAKTK
ncbi:MAG TPA: ankyrin repeat domain-containing protein [Spirochaetota bacterium]|nr:ankyrin repeat domain-containing protein [Spirochaetota bacterium]